ncbi:unnamed protein product [Cylicocyclus nassatus]|uniref:MULE transposase domain-containing protein n=1 Tax=Cylicocyclus nassatus TaxID=53992 RepID=A0AA36GW62_CYLNA|nr:unnamed protein product [Cylicocyclus nassatus]
MVVLSAASTILSAKVWLDAQCERTSTTFYKRTSCEGGKAYSLRCNRAGIYQKTTTARATSTKKDVVACSCFVNVYAKNDGTLSVKGCFGHAGHNVEPALLRLTSSQEQFVRSLLEEHSMDYVIHRLKRDFSAKENRLYFINRNDLWNITYKYGLRPGYYHKNDMNSLLLRSAEGNPNDGIRLLNISDDPSGKGFRMVIITPIQIEWLKRFSGRGIAVDDTHNVTRYCLKLATVTVADNKDRGLPAAFLLSGTMTASDVYVLFVEIAKLVPNFAPQQVVTDEAPCFYNAFRLAFPRSDAKLHYCRWHIHQTFKRATTRLVEARLRLKLNKDLRDLLLITDLNEFELKFGQIIAFLEVEGQTAMATYLRENYLGRTASWASFANRGAVLDTTMISERWHLRLKKDLLQRNANSRADFLVDLLIKAVEDIADTTEIRDRRRLANASYRVQETSKCHRWALEYYERKPEKVVKTGDCKWLVQGKNPEEAYEVIQAKCPCAESNVHCPLCDVCPYQWSCDCLDNRAGISCIHRHAAKLFGGSAAQRSSSSVEPSVTDDQAAFLFDASATRSSSSQVTDSQQRKQQRSQIRSSIESKFAVISTNVNVMVNTDSEQAMNFLQDIYQLVDQASSIKLQSATQEYPALAVRTELSKPGGKPLMTKAELFTRSQSRIKKKQTREE